MPERLLGYFTKKRDRIRHVLVDVFDTLILRRISPEHVKRVAAGRLRRHFALVTPTIEIYLIRQRLERALCEASERAGLDADFRLEAMLGHLRLELLGCEFASLRSISAEEFVRIGMAIEYEVERFVQFVDPRMLSFLGYMKELGVPVTAVTDTYKPRAFIEDLLRHHGLTTWLQGVVVSSDFLETKRSGRLYDRVLTELGVAPAAVLMVGDNEYSDIERAGSRGILTYLLDRADTRGHYDQFERQHESIGSIQALLDSCGSGEGPFSEMACSLLMFTARLHEQLLARGAGDVFFFSREGEFLRELFEIYQQRSGHSPGDLAHIRSHYLLVSRKSTFIASLGPLSSENFSTLFRQYRELSVHEFLSSLNFPDAVIGDIARDIGVDAEQVEGDFPSSAVFVRLRENGTFQQCFESIRDQQRRLFVEYLAGFGADTSRAIHVVDVGWKGTIQDHVSLILGESPPLCGFYLGLVEYAGASPVNQKHAIVFDLTRPKSRFDLIYNANRSIFEVFTGASHGSARAYERAGDGSVQALLDENPEEQRLYQEVIRPLQRELLSGFEAMADRLAMSAVDLDDLAEYFARKHFRMVYRPTREELDFYGRLFHFENFGMLRETRFDSKSPGLGQRVGNAWRFIRDSDAVLSRGWWPPMTLRHLGLSFLVRPYGWLMRRRYFGRSDGGLAQSSQRQAAQIIELRQGIARQSQMIHERDLYIKKLEQLAVDRMEAINSQTRMIDERDACIRSLQSEVASGREHATPSSPMAP